jgi:hypothetical protein
MRSQSFFQSSFTVFSMTLFSVSNLIHAMAI